MALSCAQQTETTKTELTTVGNPFLPLWEHNVVVSSAYNSDNDHKFRNKVKSGISLLRP